MAEGKKNSSSFPDELNLRLCCSTLLCLSSHRALCCGSKPESLLALRPSLYPFWLSSSLFALFISSFLSPPPLLLAPSLCSFLTSTLSLGLFSSLNLPVARPDCGSRPEPRGFHSDTLCPNVISIDDVQLGQAVLAQGMFTVCHKVRPFT